MEKCMICDLPAPDNDDWHSHHEMLDRLRVVNAQLLAALEGLSPNIKGREANGEAYWHPIHVHPYHSFNTG